MDFVTKESKKWSVFGATVLLEYHPPVACGCSYCDDLKGMHRYSFGFWAPVCTERNAWRVLYWVKQSGEKVYLRWTLPKSRRSERAERSRVANIIG